MDCREKSGGNSAIALKFGASALLAVSSLYM